MYSYFLPQERAPALRRSRTTTTPDGRQRTNLPRSHSDQVNSRKKAQQQQDLRSAGRRSSVLLREVGNPVPKVDGILERGETRPGTSGSAMVDDLDDSIKNRLAGYR